MPFSVAVTPTPCAVHCGTSLGGCHFAVVPLKKKETLPYFKCVVDLTPWEK